jgi:hypothetical protein
MQKRSVILSFIAAFLFAAAAVLNFINGSALRGVFASIAGILFLLSGIHWKRKSGGNI